MINTIRRSLYKLYSGYIGAEVLAECISGNWDFYRKMYNQMNPTDLVWFYTGLHRFVGSQAHYDLEKVNQLLKEIIDKENQSISITELGCWRGHLADSILKSYDWTEIIGWHGYDLDYQAIDTHVVESSRFYPNKLTTWWHDIPNTKGMVMVACHTIEHLTEAQLRRTLLRCCGNNFKYLIWELPFAQDRGLNNWDGTNNTHMLNIDMTVFQFLVKGCGYDFFYHEKTAEGHMYGMVKRSLK